MRRRKVHSILGAIGLVVVCLFPKPESTIELDCVNLRIRECSRYRSWLLGFVLRETCTAPWEHPTAVRLRELGVLAPVRDEHAQWAMIKGFKVGVRGWYGAGHDYLYALGPVTMLTPAPWPANEDLSKNIWVEWAVKDPAAAKHFWQEVQAIAARTQDVSYYVSAAKGYLENHKLDVVGSELEAHARFAIGEL